MQPHLLAFFHVTHNAMGTTADPRITPILKHRVNVYTFKVHVVAHVTHECLLDITMAF